MSTVKATAAHGAGGTRHDDERLTVAVPDHRPRALPVEYPRAEHRQTQGRECQHEEGGASRRTGPAAPEAGRSRWRRAPRLTPCGCAPRRTWSGSRTVVSGSVESDALSVDGRIGRLVERRGDEFVHVYQLGWAGLPVSSGPLW